MWNQCSVICPAKVSIIDNEAWIHSLPIKNRNAWLLGKVKKDRPRYQLPGAPDTAFVEMHNHHRANEMVLVEG